MEWVDSWKSCLGSLSFLARGARKRRMASLSRWDVIFSCTLFYLFILLGRRTYRYSDMFETPYEHEYRCACCCEAVMNYPDMHAIRLSIVNRVSIYYTSVVSECALCWPRAMILHPLLSVEVSFALFRFPRLSRARFCLASQ